MKKITLVACPWIFHGPAEFMSQQLGLGYIGAYAEMMGHKVVAFIDPMVAGGMSHLTPLTTKYQQTSRVGYSDSWIVERIPSDTDVIGINAPFTDSRLTLYPLIRKIKEKFPSIPVMVGGVLATTLPRQVIAESLADIAIKGEGEVAFSRILNDEPWKSIPGLVFRLPDGTIYEHDQPGQQLPVGQIPSPGYNFRPMGEYTKWSPRGNRGDRTLSMVSSRGCPFACEFCSSAAKGQYWNPLVAGSIVQEIEMSIEHWGVNHVEFEDDNFTFNEERAVAILEALTNLRRRGVPIACSFPNGVMIDRMSEELAGLMKSAGAEIIYLPLESGDPRVLMAMNKPNSEDHLDKTMEVAKWCVEAGLFVSAFVINAYPGGRVSSKNCQVASERYSQFLFADEQELFLQGEDEASFQKTMAFCQRLRQLGVNGITPLIATPYPGTGLYVTSERFDWLTFEDGHDVLITMSYSSVTPGLIQLETPWCSQQRAYERWKEMMEEFPAYHNIRKE